jgi:hypothetical protein
MELKCPHCGGVLEITKAQTITSAKSVGRPSGSLQSGIIKAAGESIEERMVKKVESGVNAAISSLEALNALANGSFSKNGDGLASGWGGSMSQVLRARSHLVEKESVGGVAGADLDSMDKAVLARKVQNLMHGALNKNSDAK